MALTSSNGKAKLLQWMLFLTLLDHKDHPVLDFPLLQSTNFVITVTVQEVFWLIKSLDSKVAIRLDKISVAVLKNISPELFPLLVKWFNCCLKERYFPNIWKILTVCPMFKNAGEQSFLSQYWLTDLLKVIRKLFGSIINKKVVEHLHRNNHLSNNQYGFLLYA